MVLLSHPHVDHLLGLPMCPMVFDPAKQIDIYGTVRKGMDVRRQVCTLLAPPLWPVGPEKLPARITFRELPEQMLLGDVAVESIDGVHPGGVSLFRLTGGGKTVVIMTDCTVTEENIPVFAKFARDCDLLEDETIPEDEKDKLEEIQKQAQNLKNAVEEAQTAIDNDVTQKVEDKNETNVELDDKTDLEKAKDTLEDALSDENKGNYTPTEQAEIQQEIDRLEKAIEQTEAVIDAIEKLPSSVEPDLNEADEKAIRNAKDAYDKLSDYQKSLIDKADKDKLEKLFDILDDYEITKGNKQKWENGSGKALVFTANGPDRKFKELRIDGKVVGTSNYTHKDGSTIITLKASYLQTLSTGKHTIQVVCTDGETGGKDYFRIYNSGGNPSTGDNMNLMLMSGVAMTSLLCIAMMIMFVPRKKGKYQR